VMNVIGIFLGIGLKIEIAFANIAIFTILILLMEIIPFFCSLFQFLSSMVYSFHCRGLSFLLLILFPGIFWGYSPVFFLSLLFFF
jgi:hypothetical protein